MVELGCRCEDKRMKCRERAIPAETDPNIPEGSPEGLSQSKSNNNLIPEENENLYILLNSEENTRKLRKRLAPKPSHSMIGKLATERNIEHPRKLLVGARRYAGRVALSISHRRLNNQPMLRNPPV
jgi:hypothetical protein